MEYALQQVMTATELKELLARKLMAASVEVSDESAQHRGHLGAMSGGGHFRVRIVANVFEGKSLIDRHRMVNEAVGMGANPLVHALSIQAFTEEEWNARS